MIPPDQFPANMPRDNIIVAQSVKILELGSPLVTNTFITRAMQVNVLVNELFKEMPDADFIEIRAIRYDVKEDTDGGTVTGAPDA